MEIRDYCSQKQKCIDEEAKLGEVTQGDPGK